MKVYIVVLPWDYSSADVKGVFRLRADAERELKLVQRDERNGSYAFIAQSYIYG